MARGNSSMHPFFSHSLTHGHHSLCSHGRSLPLPDTIPAPGPVPSSHSAPSSSILGPPVYPLTVVKCHPCSTPAGLLPWLPTWRLNPHTSERTREAGKLRESHPNPPIGMRDVKPHLFIFVAVPVQSIGRAGQVNCQLLVDVLCYDWVFSGRHWRGSTSDLALGRAPPEEWLTLKLLLT